MVNFIISIIVKLCIHHYSDIIWESWCLKSLATGWFVQQLVQANNKVKKWKLCITGLLLNRMMHICVSKLTSIASDNGFSSGQHQAIIWTNDEILGNPPVTSGFPSQRDSNVESISMSLHHHGPFATTINWWLPLLCNSALYEGIILWMRPANERWRYNVTSSLIGWVHTQFDPCVCLLCPSDDLCKLILPWDNIDVGELWQYDQLLSP